MIPSFISKYLNNPLHHVQLELEIPKALDDLIMWMITKDAEDRPTLQQIRDVLKGYPYEEEEIGVMDLPTRLILVVNARQGMFRVLTTEGDLHDSFGDIGMGKEHFFAVPQAVTVDQQGNYYLALVEQTNIDEGQLIQKLNSKGEVIGSFGKYGMRAGQLLNPIALAVHQDYLYVIDGETYKIQRFDLEGELHKSFSVVLGKSVGNLITLEC